MLKSFPLFDLQQVEVLRGPQGSLFGRKRNCGWNHRGKYNFFLYEALEYKARPLLEGGLRLGYREGRGRFEAAAFVRNLANKLLAVNAIDFNNFTGVVNEPRSYGVQLTFAY